MQVKRYCCTDVREALRQIRRDLGPDAVVIGTRELPHTPGQGRRGRPLVEVTAAVDREAAEEATRATVDADALAAAASDDMLAGATAALARLAREEDALPTVVLPAADTSATVAAERFSWLVDVLVGDGLEAPLAAEVVAEAAGQVGPVADTLELRAAVAGVIARRLGAEVPPWHADERVMVFFGPSGGGRTTVLAKVAAFAAFQREERVAIVTTDARAGANGRLQALATAMGLRVFAASGAWQLRATLMALEGYDRVLVDTAPLSAAARPAAARDEGPLGDTGALLAALPARRYLVLPADAATRHLLAVARSAAPLGIDALVATRVDEAPGCGAVFSVQQATDWPLALVGTGPRVPDDVEVVRAEAFAARVLAPPAARPSGLVEGSTDARSRFVA